MDAVVIVAICLLPAIVVWFGVSWPGCVVAVLCGVLCAGAVPAGGVAVVFAGCWSARVLKGDNLDCSFICGVSVRWGSGVVLVLPYFLL